MNDVGNWVKNWSKLPTDSTKKLPTWGRGCQKSGKIADIVYGRPLMCLATSAPMPRVPKALVCSCFLDLPRYLAFL